MNAMNTMNKGITQFDVWTLDFFLGALQTKLKSYRGRVIDLSQCETGPDLLRQCRDAGLTGKFVGGSRPYLWVEGRNRPIMVKLPRNETNSARKVSNRL